MLKIRKQLNGRFQVECLLKNPSTGAVDSLYNIENIDYDRLIKFLDRSNISSTEIDNVDWLLEHTHKTIEFNDQGALQNVVNQ